MNVLREKLTWITAIFLKQIHSNLCHLFNCRLKKKKKAVPYPQKQQQREYKRTESELIFKQPCWSEKGAKGPPSRGAKRLLAILNSVILNSLTPTVQCSSHHQQMFQLFGHQLGVLLIQLISDTNHLESAGTPADAKFHNTAFTSDTSLAASPRLPPTLLTNQ